MGAPCYAVAERLSSRREEIAPRGEGSRAFLALVPSMGWSVAGWCETCVERRAREGSRSGGTERTMLGYVARSELGTLLLADVDRPALWRFVDWLGEQKAARTGKLVSGKWQRDCLSFVRASLEDALNRGLVAHNAARGMRLVRPDDREDAGWTFLSPEEQLTLSTCARIPEGSRLFIAAAMYTGMRPGELRHLEVRDVHLDDPAPYAFVRFGGRTRSRKNRKPYRAKLIPTAVIVLRLALRHLRHHCPDNPRGLLFPTPQGAPQPTGGRFTEWWRECLAVAGIERAVRFYDLRHTACTSLVAGYWGRVWTLREAQEFMGHLDYKSTLRYAHLAPSVIDAAAAATPGLAKAPVRPRALWLGLEDVAHAAAAGAVVAHYAARRSAELAAFESMDELIRDAAADADAAMQGHARRDSNSRPSGSKPEGRGSAYAEEGTGGCSGGAPDRGAGSGKADQSASRIQHPTVPSSAHADDDGGDEPPLDAWAESGVVRRSALEANAPERAPERQAASPPSASDRRSGARSRALALAVELRAALGRAAACAEELCAALGAVRKGKM